MPAKKDSEAIVRDIKRKTRKKYTAEEKISIVLEGLRGEESIAAICRREGINQNHEPGILSHISIRSLQAADEEYS